MQFTLGLNIMFANTADTYQVNSPSNFLPSSFSQFSYIVHYIKIKRFPSVISSTQNDLVDYREYETGLSCKQRIRQTTTIRKQLTDNS